ncbi:Uncharacterised protein [uncultured Clostridium sp.]|nr:Uncharacterised protein [uncultured Clostridium sp.]
MGNKTTKKKKHTQPGQTDRRIRGAILVLVILILCVAAYGISTLLPKGAGKKKEAKARPEITSVIIGDTEGTIEKVEEDGEERYEICATLPIDFPFEKTTLNLELSDGAKVSDASNCILTDLGGRWVVNLTVEDACVVIEAGEQSRTYYFRLDVE